MNKVGKPLIIFLAVAFLASSASLSFGAEKSNKIKTKVHSKIGDEVSLFYGGGSGDIKEVFPIGSVLDVFKRNKAFGPNIPQKVGKVEVVSYVDDNHFKGKMLEGRVNEGDILKLKPGSNTPGAMVMPRYFNW